jgi:hypothetical protein
MVAIIVNSDDETPTRPAEGNGKAVVRRTRPSIKNEPAAKIPALSFISKTPTVIKSESSSSSFTPASGADMNGMPRFIATTWSTVFLPACYRALFRSHDPMALGGIGRNLKDPGADTLVILREVLEQTYPGNTWALEWGDVICSKVPYSPRPSSYHDALIDLGQAVSRIGERRSMVAKVILQIVDRGFEAGKYYEALDSPIPGARIRKTETVAADTRDALRPNGPAFFKFPTPENVSKLDPRDPTYIVCAFLFLRPL